MKIRNYLLGALAVALFGNTLMLVTAQELDGVTMELSTKENKRGNHVHMRAHHIIFDYMLKHGDITQEEIDDDKQQRRLHRRELRRLKNAGDTDAFNARLAEIKKAHKSKREKVREYIKNAPELEKILHETHNKRMKERNDPQHKKNKPDHHFDSEHKPPKPYHLDNPEEDKD